MSGRLPLPPVRARPDLVAGDVDARAARARLTARLRRVALACAACGGTLSLVALAGWATGFEPLASLVPGLPAMKADAAACGVLASIALVIRAGFADRRRLQAVAIACAALIVTTGVLTIAEYASRRGLGIDQLLFDDRFDRGARYPGRLSVGGALSVLLLGGALLTWDLRVGRWWVSNVLAPPAAAVGVLAVTGYATGGAPLLKALGPQPIALGAALAMTFLPAGVLLARSDRGRLMLLASPSHSGRVLRVLATVTVAVPIGVAVLTLAGQRLSLLGPAAGAWVFASVVALSFAAAAWLISGAAEFAETRRARADRELQRLAQAAEHGTDAIISVDLQTRVCHWNRGAERLYGHSAEEAIGRTIDELAIMVDAFGNPVMACDLVAAAAAHGGTFTGELPRRRKDGALIDVRLTLAPWQVDGQLVGYTAIAFDITERKRAERARERAFHDLEDAQRLARLAEERFRQAFDEAPIGMALISQDGRVERANAALIELSGRMREDIEGADVRNLLHPADAEGACAALAHMAAGTATGQVKRELRILPAVGSARRVAVHATLLGNLEGQPKRVLCQFEDVTERRRFEEQLQFLADHDPLTGLMNRRRFESELESHVARVRRDGPAGALLVLDLDNFKGINDMLGHSAGDQFIVSTAGALRRRLRESDVLARLGGDEFAVLLHDADRAQAAHVAQALEGAVRSNIVLVGDERRTVTTSVGIAMFDGDARPVLSGESALIDADLAMYDAKEAGRDGHAFSATSEGPTSRTRAQLTWVSRLEHALEHDGFALLAQPILDLETGQVHQHELLLRMVDEDGDLIPPAAFLAIAERFGLVAKLDRWVATRAIELIEEHPHLTFEVNISGKSLGDQQLLEAIDARLRAGRVDPTHLVFEVTETAAIANITNAQAFAERLRDHGCRFALDDFGAGFGSFYYLKHLPFDYIKIDGEFVAHVVSGRIDQLVIEAVVRIAQGLGKETIAEFVTDERTQRMVRQLGVDYAQGHHIGRPVPIAELLHDGAGEAAAGAPTPAARLAQRAA